jgi:hypothetical protein
MRPFESATWQLVRLGRSDLGDDDIEQLAG